MDLEDLLTPAAVDAFIENHICDDRPGLLATAKRGDFTQCHRMQDPKLDAVCKALEWRQKLIDQIQSGQRLLTGELVKPHE